MNKFLNRNRNFISSFLWIPFSWLVQSVVFAVLIQVAVSLMRINYSLEPRQALAVIFSYPLIFVIAALICALFRALKYTTKDSGKNFIFIRSFLWIFSLPARGWIVGWWWLIRFVTLFFIPVVIFFMGLMITWLIVSMMVDYGASSWFIILVGIAIPAISIGGSRWANQYGSGTTGGAPIGLFLVFALSIPAVVFTLFFLVFVLSAFAFPATAYIILTQTGVIEGSGNRVFDWMVALGIFAALIIPPVAIENGGNLISNIREGWNSLTPSGKKKKLAKDFLERQEALQIRESQRKKLASLKAKRNEVARSTFGDRKVGTNRTDYLNTYSTIFDPKGRQFRDNDEDVR